jgi:hypothetical protein
VVHVVDKGAADAVAMKPKVRTTVPQN